MTTIPALNISWSPASETGTEGSAIALPGISIKGAPGGGLLSAIISGLPAGAVLSDGRGHSFTAKAGSTSVDVHTWYLPGLSIVAPNDTNFTLTLTGKDLLGRTASATQGVIVAPLAPAVAPVAATGVEGAAIALNLGVTVNSRSGDTNGSTVTLIGVARLAVRPRISVAVAFSWKFPSSGATMVSAARSQVCTSTDVRPLVAVKVWPWLSDKVAPTGIKLTIRDLKEPPAALDAGAPVTVRPVNEIGLPSAPVANPGDHLMFSVGIVVMRSHLAVSWNGDTCQCSWMLCRREPSRPCRA